MDSAPTSWLRPLPPSAPCSQQSGPTYIHTYLVLALPAPSTGRFPRSSMFLFLFLARGRGTVVRQVDDDHVRASDRRTGGWQAATRLVRAGARQGKAGRQPVGWVGGWYHQPVARRYSAHGCHACHACYTCMHDCLGSLACLHGSHRT